MDFLSQHVIPPTGHYMMLLEFLAVVVYLVHLPYVGAVVGSTALSMWLSFRDREIPDSRYSRFAGDLVDAVLRNKAAMFVLGVCPLFVLPFVYVEWFHGVDASPIRYIPLVIPGAIVGFGFIRLYYDSYVERRHRFGYHMLAGLAGIVFLKISYFILVATVARLHDPEKWFRVKDLFVMLLNWNAIWKFAFLVHASIAFTGVAALYLFFVVRRREMQRDPTYSLFVSRFSAGLALAFTFAMPVYYLLFIFTTPDVALDNVIYVLAAVVCAVAMLIAQLLIAVLRDGRPRALLAMTLFVAIFAISSTVDLRAMANANAEHFHLVANKAATAYALREASLEARMKAKREGLTARAGTITASGGALVPVGERLYKMKGCMACHSIDGTRFIGPSLKGVFGQRITVVTDGKPRQITVDEAYLRKSILDPNADIVSGFKPLMPSQAGIVDDSEISALIEYIKSLR